MVWHTLRHGDLQLHAVGGEVRAAVEQAVVRLLEGPRLLAAGIWDLALLLRQHAVREWEEQRRLQETPEEAAAAQAEPSGQISLALTPGDISC